jgi:hypothetical protein
VKVIVREPPQIGEVPTAVMIRGTSEIGLLRAGVSGVHGGGLSQGRCQTTVHFRRTISDNRAFAEFTKRPTQMGVWFRIDLCLGLKVKNSARTDCLIVTIGT